MSRLVLKTERTERRKDVGKFIIYNASIKVSLCDPKGYFYIVLKKCVNEGSISN